MIKKNLKVISLLLITPISAPVYATGIPVIDVANLANSIQNIVKWSQQLQQMSAQLDEQKKQFDSLNGLRNVGKLLKNDLLSQYIPMDYQAAVNQLLDGGEGGFSGISGSISSIVNSHQIVNCETLNSEDFFVDQCKKHWKKLALNRNIGELGYKKASQNIANLQSFVSAITSSTDPKSLQDLQARIAVEQVKMQNEKMKLDTIRIMEEADQKLRTQQANDAFSASLALGSDGGISF